MGHTEQNVHVTLKRTRLGAAPGFLGLVLILQNMEKLRAPYRRTEECSRHPLFDVREARVGSCLRVLLMLKETCWLVWCVHQETALC